MPIADHISKIEFDMECPCCAKQLHISLEAGDVEKRATEEKSGVFKVHTLAVVDVKFHKITVSEKEERDKTAVLSKIVDGKVVHESRGRSKIKPR